MRTVFRSLGLVALVLAAPVVATKVVAAPGLRGLMHEWKAGARATGDMLAGRLRYDEATIRAALQNYVDGAGQVAAQVNAQNAEGRDFRSRFVQFQADAKAALGDVSRPTALKADFSRIRADCESCHNTYQD